MISNRLAKEYLATIHEINCLDDQIHRAELDLLTIRGKYQRDSVQACINDMNRRRDNLIMIQLKDKNSILCKVLYEKLCDEIGKLATDEYLEETMQDMNIII